MKTPTRPMGETNQSRIRVQANHVEHWLNGVKVLAYDCGSDTLKAALAASKFKRVPGFGNQVKGRILLQDHHAQVWFRNLKIRELAANDTRASLRRLERSHLEATHAARLRFASERRPVPSHGVYESFRAIIHAHAEDAEHTQGTRQEFFEAKEPGPYRLEAWLTVDGEDRPWIYANPVYLKVPALTELMLPSMAISPKVEPHKDLNRIYVAGHSAGGHLAALLALDERYLAAHQLSSRLIRGVLPLSGVSNLAGQEGQESVFGKDPETRRSASPLFHVQAGAPSFLVTYCEWDYFALPAQAREFCRTLMQAGIDTTLVCIPNESHNSEMIRVTSEKDLTVASALRFMK